MPVQGRAHRPSPRSTRAGLTVGLTVGGAHGRRRARLTGGLTGSRAEARGHGSRADPDVGLMATSWTGSRSPRAHEGRGQSRAGLTVQALEAREPGRAPPNGPGPRSWTGSPAHESPAHGGPKATSWTGPTAARSPGDHLRMPLGSVVEAPGRQRPARLVDRAPRQHVFVRVDPDNRHDGLLSPAVALWQDQPGAAQTCVESPQTRLLMLLSSDITELVHRWGGTHLASHPESEGMSNRAIPTGASEFKHACHFVSGIDLVCCKSDSWDQRLMSWS